MSVALLQKPYQAEDSCYIHVHVSYFSRAVRKSDFCLCTADQRLWFCYMDSNIPLLLKSKISSFLPFSVTVHCNRPVCAEAGQKP